MGMTTGPALAAAESAGDSHSVGDLPGSRTRSREARRDLLERICEFVMKHDLEATGENLSVICRALSGSNQDLAETFAAREISGEPIDQCWLDRSARLTSGTSQQFRQLETLMDKMEQSLVRFARTAKSAQDETSDHRGALAGQLDAFEQGTDGEVDPPAADRVIALSLAMLDRLERIETAMQRSQAETDALRESLARARSEADVDHLTRLPNRRAFERRLLSAAREARDNDQPLCVAFCDVDRFKQVNDTHGHQAGDRVLCAVADTLSGIASDECFIARHGGEEFVLLFQGLSKDEARRKLDRARLTLAGRRMVNRANSKPFGQITFSGGVAEVTEQSDPRSALARADAALYEAKKAGRNRIIAI